MRLAERSQGDHHPHFALRDEVHLPHGRALPRQHPAPQVLPLAELVRQLTAVDSTHTHTHPARGGMEPVGGRARQ